MRFPEKQTMTEVIALLHDQPYGVSLEIIRNIRTLTRRTSHEGLAFLTKLLPSVGKRFDRALSGNVAFSIVGLLKKSGDTCFPHFLGSALRRVFDSRGILLDNPCIATVKWLRTVFFYSYKIEVPFDEKTITKFGEAYIAVDQEVATDTNSIRASLLNRMRHSLRRLPSEGDNPSFGPGVSSNCKREEKWKQYVPPSTLRHHFGRSFFHDRHEFLEEENVLFFVSSYLRAFLHIDSSPIFGLTNSSVLFVPKDSRGPRTICCEDSRLMWAQKSLQKMLYRYIESSEDFGGRVNFTDQTINQQLTFDKRFATLDLKEASDRVSNALVQEVFPEKLNAAMQACRSPYHDVPLSGGFKTIKARKFAPMGSALCFPVMALIAFTAVINGISLSTGIPTSSLEVYIYGDDIVVPNEYASIAMDCLDEVGLVVNKDKSFVYSRFTESCGQDTLDQACVTPLRKKKMPCSIERTRVNGRIAFRDNGFIAHYVSLANRARSLGYYNLNNSLRDCVAKSLPHALRIPYGVPESPYLNWHCDPEDVYVFNHDRERGLGLRALVVKDVELNLRLTPLQRLRRDLLEGGGDKPLDPNRLGARSTYLQPRNLRKWGTSYG